MSEQTLALQTHQLSIGYQHSRHKPVVVGHDLSLTLKRGALVGLLGPNGAGKSTLLRTLAGMQKPLSGEVALSGVNTDRISPRELSQSLGVVLTDHINVGMMNGYALVALGRHPYTDWTGTLSAYDQAMVRWAVDAVNAGDIADKPVSELSDGQRQKLMIARALAQETDVILLDEPTAFLDLPHRVEIMQLLNSLAKETQRAILLSTHDLDLALRTCDELWLMADGQIRTGSPEDLVLGDAFEATFHKDGLRFDKHTGTFSIERHHRQAVHVIGDGIASVWTCRALERLGYVVDVTADVTIIIQSAGDDTVWQLSTDPHNTSYHSISQVLQVLEEQQHDGSG